MTKTELTNKLKIVEKYGYLVKTFNSQRAMNKGTAGMTDHLIIGRGRMYFIEVKLGKDKFSDKQTEFKNEIEKVKGVIYLIATELNYQSVINQILTK